MENYECDQCGACCRSLIVEADLIDIQREPKIAQAESKRTGKPVEQIFEELHEEMRVVIIACGEARPCSLLNKDNFCSIYPTRPNDCVAMQAGDEQCQQAREREGIEPLLPSE